MKLNLTGTTTLWHGEWMRVRWGTMAQVKLTTDKHCKKCRREPVNGALAWWSIKHGTIYCEACYGGRDE